MFKLPGPQESRGFRGKYQRWFSCGWKEISITVSWYHRKHQINSGVPHYAGSRQILSRSDQPHNELLNPRGDGRKEPKLAEALLFSAENRKEPTQRGLFAHTHPGQMAKGSRFCELRKYFLAFAGCTSFPKTCKRRGGTGWQFKTSR